MKILIIGAGGREHAIAWKVAQSSSVTEVFVAPGNAGTALEPKVFNIEIPVSDITQLVAFAKKNAITLTIVGPEAPLAAGIVDTFTQEGLTCFGPTQAAAQLESSKAFCKNFLKNHHLPTAQFAVFRDKEKALAYLKKHTFPIVIKASGLAAGKGVVIAKTLEEAENTVCAMLTQGSFGTAGKEIVIEEFLEGEELSFIVLTDGKTILPLASAQDHKKRDAGDLGPNTGGMGAYSPAPLLTPALEKTILDTIIKPTIDGLRDQGIPYIGFLYAGLMITPSGRPSILEFNCRLGDPETQPLLMRLQSPLETLCLYAAKQKLSALPPLKWDPRAALCIVMAANGYPDHYEKEQPLTALMNYSHTIDTKVFHAGTKLSDGKILSCGGRVLTVCALGDSLREAKKTASAEVEKLACTTLFYRTDIGDRGILASVVA